MQVQNTVLGMTENLSDDVVAWLREGNVMQRRYNVGARSRDIGVILVEDESWAMPKLAAVDWDAEAEAEIRAAEKALRLAKIIAKNQRN